MWSLRPSTEGQCTVFDMSFFRHLFSQYMLFSFNKQYLSSDDWVEDKRGDRRNCSVLYLVAQSCTLSFSFISQFHARQCPGSIPGTAVTYFGKRQKAGMVHSVSGCTRGVQVKLRNPLRTHAIPEHLRGVITTRCYTNPRLPCLILHDNPLSLLNHCLVYLSESIQPASSNPVRQRLCSASSLDFIVPRTRTN